jgi:hypothetical protein
MKKKLATIAFAFAFISLIPCILAQQAPPAPAENPVPAPTPKLEADDKPDQTSRTNKTDAASNPSDSAEDLSKAEAWRREVLAWSHPRRIGEGTESGSISEMSRPVLVLGTVNGDISTLSRDVAVLGDVTGDISAVSGTVTVLGTVGGDISVVGGDLRVAGKVNGDASVVGGALETAGGGRVLGETSTVGKGNFKFNFNRSWPGGRHLHSQSFFHSFWLSPFMFMWRSALLILWIALGCAIAALFTPAVLRARAELQSAPARSVAFGFLWTVLFWMLLVACIILSFVVIGIPLLIVLVAFHLALGAFGMTLTFSVVGEWLARRLNHAGASIYAAVFVGACFLGLARLVPVFGSVIWFAAGLFGIGAALASRFGTAPPALAPSTTLPPAATVS